MRPRITIAAILLAAGCGDGAGPGTAAALQLLGARARWEDREPRGYSFEYHETCFCAAGDGVVYVDVRVEVVEGVVVTVTPLPPIVLAGASRPPLLLELPEFSPTIDGVFERVATVLRGGADGLEVEYDTQYGFPRLVAVDLDRDAPDDGFHIEVREFRDLGPIFHAGP